VAPVTAFLLEMYVAAGDEAAGDRLRAATRDLAGEGRTVQPLRSILVPEDETWLLLVEADGEEAVCEATRRAGLRVDRLTEAIALAGD
jgi:hypothetical protein